MSGHANIEDTTSFNFSIDRPMLAAIRKASIAQDRSMSAVVRSALRAYLAYLITGPDVGEPKAQPAPAPAAAARKSQQQKRRREPTSATA